MLNLCSINIMACVEAWTWSSCIIIAALELQVQYYYNSAVSMQLTSTPGFADGNYYLFWYCASVQTPTLYAK